MRNWQIGDKILNRWKINDILKGGMGMVSVAYKHKGHETIATLFHARYGKIRVDFFKGA